MNLSNIPHAPLLFAMVWSIMLLIAYIAVSKRLNHRDVTLSGPTILLVLIGTALFARLIPNAVLPMGAGYDIESYQIVGNLILGGKDVYTAAETANRYPYLPLDLYWSALAHWLSVATHLSFTKIVRLAFIAADTGIAIVLFWGLKRRTVLTQAFRGGMLYALNPIPVFISAFHGQFDAVPALCLLIAILTVHNSALVSGSWLGVGILAKSWPVFGLPSLFVRTTRKRRALFLVGVILAPLLGVGVYVNLFDSSASAVLGRALGYNRGVGVWGYTYLVRLLAYIAPAFQSTFNWLVANGRYITLAALGLVWLFRARKEQPAGGVLTILVTFFATTHAFAIQYLLWPIPFAILVQDDIWLRRYTLGAFAYMFLAYTTLVMEMHITNLLPWPQADMFIIIPAGVPVWLVTIGWMVSRLTRRSATESNIEPTMGQ